MSGPVVLCVGEPLVALTPPVHSSLEHADDLLVSVGGAELNVAVALAALGTPSRFVGRVGDDPLGRRIVTVLGAAAVDARYVEVDADAPTALYLKDPGHTRQRVHYYRRGGAGSRLRSVPDAALNGVEHIHLSGITPALSVDCAHLVDTILNDRTRTVSFDVNHRAALWPGGSAGAVLLRMARAAHTVFVGLDEATDLWGCAAAADVRALMPGVPELVVKDGERPATAFLGNDHTSEPASVVTVVEPIGAGDAFAAGYLHARRAGSGAAAALRAGHREASATLTVLGDHGTPTAAGNGRASVR